MLRRLDSGAKADTWLSPEIDTSEFVSSLVGVSMVFVLELIIHLSYWIGFSMPLWAWLMLLCPTEGTAVATCLFGLSVWCDVILGTLGLNVLELFTFGFGGDNKETHYHGNYQAMDYDAKTPYRSAESSFYPGMR